MTSAVRVRAFVADLPDLTPEELTQAYAWADKKFERSTINRRGEAGYTLAALCQEEKSVRQWQSLLRTNLQHWNVTLPSTPQKGWLRALSADEFDALVVTPGASAASEAPKPCDVDSEPDYATTNNEQSYQDETVTVDLQENAPPQSCQVFMPLQLRLPPNLLTPIRAW